MKKLISFIFFLICALTLVGCETGDIEIDDLDKATLVEAEVVIKTSGGTYRMYPEHQEWLSGVGTYERGSNVTLTVNIPEDSPYIFAGWYATSEDFWKGRAVCLDPTYTFKAELDLYTGIMARIEKYAIQMDCGCIGCGKVDGFDDREFPIGKKKTLTATPYMGYNFDGWYVDNELVSIDESFDFIADENMKKIEAKFIVDPRLANFEIRSDEANCTITNVIDKTIEEVAIPRMVTSIGYGAFSDCTNLKKIVLPDRLISIYAYAFSNCDSLTSIVLPRGIKEIYSTIFNGCDSLTDVYYNGTLENWFDVRLNYDSLDSHDVMFLDRNGEIEYEGNKYTKYDEIIIPNTISIVGGYQFYGFKNIKDITISSYVEKIGYYAFFSCYNLENIYYNGTPDDWCNINMESSPMECANNIYFIDRNGTIEHNGKYYKKITELVVPDSISEICDGLFMNFSMNKVVISNGINKIGIRAFSCCDNLTEIVIPNSIKDICFDSFGGCLNLSKVYYEGTIDEWQEINIDSYNIDLLNSTIYYYSGTAPTEAGNYWHYVNNVPTIWS